MGERGQEGQPRALTTAPADPHGTLEQIKRLISSRRHAHTVIFAIIRHTDNTDAPHRFS